MIDFHCHIDLYSDPDQIVRICNERRLSVLSVTTTPSAWQGTSSLAKGKIKTAIGLHPQLAQQRMTELELFEELLPQTQFVGEIGLDGTSDLRAHWNTQYSVFNHILRACERSGGRIISIHSRRACNAVLECVSAHPNAGIPVLHWFSGGKHSLERAINLGCWFSVGPTMLFGERGRDLAKRMPRDRILTESDGPLALVNGRSILPWEVEKAIEKLAEIWQIPRFEVQGIIDANFQRITKHEISSKETSDTSDKPA